jgi:hypothetical protein
MTTAIGLELVHLRALGKTGRAAALKAMRQRRGANPMPEASRQSQSRNTKALAELDAGVGREDETSSVRFASRHSARGGIRYRQASTECAAK